MFKKEVPIDCDGEDEAHMTVNHVWVKLLISNSRISNFEMFNLELISHLFGGNNYRVS